MNRRDVLKASLGSLIAVPLVFGREVEAALAPAAGKGVEPTHWTAESDVVWRSPSRDASGSMPLGNGEVGINLWVEENGDLLFYISRSDSFSEIGRLLKVGKIRVTLTPNPFTAGASFQQVLRLQHGVCEITAGEGTRRVTLQIFVDCDLPVVHCLGRSASPVHVSARVESWRREAHTLKVGEEESSAWTVKEAPYPLTEAADIFPPVPNGVVAWFHRNEVSTAYTSTIKIQSLEPIAGTMHDPLLHRTFGGWLTAENFAGAGESTLATPVPLHSFALRVAVPCLQTATTQKWTATAKAIAHQADDAGAALKRTAAWWEGYWHRSHVVVRGDRGIVVPGRTHPLRIGYDSNGQNTFPGQLGRTGVYGRPLSGAEILRL